MTSWRPMWPIPSQLGDQVSRRRFLGIVGATIVVSSCGDDGDPDPPTTTSDPPNTSDPPTTSESTTTSEPSDF